MDVSGGIIVGVLTSTVHCPWGGGEGGGVKSKWMFVIDLS